MGTRAEIVGVIADVRYEPQRQQLPIAGDVYVNLQQRGALGAYVTIRTGSDPRRHLAAMRNVLAEIDPDLPLYDVTTMEEQLAGVQSFARFTTLLLTLFAVLALALAVVGVYGTLSYAVASRRREIGIRVALGASREHVLGLVLRDGLTVCAIGLGLGVPLAVASTRAMRALLYDVQPGDPLAFVLGIVILAVTGALACIVPARRAAGVSPTVALRQ